MRHPLRPLALLVAAALPGAPLAAQQAESALHTNLFADFNYTDTQRPIAEGFKLGQIVGHVAWGLTDRVTFFSEASVTGSSTGYALEVERITLRYDAREWLRLSGGRVHTPIGYWNRAFHHGQWLQTTIARPEMVRGGNALIPLHFVGVLADGERPVGPLGLGYVVGLGNGRGTSITRSGDGGDANNSRAVVAAGTIRLPSSTGIQLGVSTYVDRLTPTTSLDVRERIVAGHVVMDRESPEIIVEYARVTHDAKRPVHTPVTSATYYTQLGYRLPGKASAWKPYVRWDHSLVPAGDTILTPLKLNYDGLTGGVRFDVVPGAALKVEYRGERLERAKRLRTIAASLSFTLSSLGHHTPAEAPPVAEEPQNATPTDSASTGHDTHHD